MVERRKEQGERTEQKVIGKRFHERSNLESAGRSTAAISGSLPEIKHKTPSSLAALKKILHGEKVN